MDIAFLFPFILLIGVMFLMTRSAKNRQRQAMEMRDSMEPGTGVRTIGGMYAEVKEVREDTVLLELAPGVHALFAKNAIGAVLDADEYERIINGESPYDDEDAPVVPDDASSLTEGSDAGDDDRVELGRKDSAEAAAEGETKNEDSARDGENGSKS
ncbi:preprotein translocase subunit YajC [Streptomyces sp. NPDC059853]|uniref:preprotein translocase subunit YajC n=1 Tax=Streptomyces sp. NPDC059853 TaxID=3346973 RepID=UPI0036587F42